MKNLTPENIAKACGGVYRGPSEAKTTEVTAITTDSRRVEPGCLFVAIPGARVDGHDFIPQVMEKGALCALSEKELGEQPYAYILVDSSLEAVKKIAAFYLEEMQIPVIGIAGSVGKTSTKEMIASVLKEKYRVLKTEGNFNNELGLPLTVFRIREENEIAVLEMGISDFGEMHRLAEVAKPDTCVMTNIGYCHLENLKDRDGILRAKSEIFDFLTPEGHIILNGDDDKLRTVGVVHGVSPIAFGLSEDHAVYADRLESKGLRGIACRIHTPKGAFEVTVPMPGTHMVYNALAGTAAGLVYGLTLEEIRKGIESYESISGRFHLIDTEKYTIIDDCYNANPVSMKASLQALVQAEGRTVAVLGDMGELGENEKELHREVGAFAAQCGVDALYCAGPLCSEMAEAARNEAGKRGNTMDIRHFPDLAELKKMLSGCLREKDTVLVKASHFMKFEEVVQELIG